MIGHLRSDEIIYDDPKLEMICRQAQGITDIDDFGCEITDEERLAIIRMKQRIKKRIATMLDEEIKKCVYKIKTGKDL